jgi:hypothetical protein
LQLASWPVFFACFAFGSAKALPKAKHALWLLGDRFVSAVTQNGAQSNESITERAVSKVF